MKIEGTLATTPYGLYSSPKIANPEETEARYVSFHAVDLRPPMPSYSAVYDGELWKFYGQGKPGEQPCFGASFVTCAADVCSSRRLPLTLRRS